MGKNRLRFTHLLFIVIFGIIIYANSLNNDFIWDDKAYLEENSFIKSWSNFTKLFSQDYFGLSGELTYRPVATLSYFVNYSLWGIKPFGHRCSNLLLHILVSILIYLLVNLVLNNRKIALIAGLFFAGHPVHTEPVLCVTFNEDILAALFLLLTFYWYVKYVQTGKRMKYYLISNVFYLLALFSKETAVVFPLVFILYDLCFVPHKKQETFWRRIKSHYWAYLMLASFYLLVRFFLLTTPDIEKTQVGYPGGSLYTGILTMSRVFISYLWLLIVPVNLKLEHIFLVSRSFFEPAVLAAFFLIFVMLIVSFKIYKYSKKTFFLLAWIFVTLLPVMNLVPFLRGSLLSEHYLYVPSIGFSVLLAVGIDNLSGFNPLRYWKNISKTLIVLILVFYSIVVVKRNADWKDEFGFWTKTVKDCPKSYISCYTLGILYQQRNQIEKAIEEYNTALRLYPEAYIVYDSLGYIYQDKGDYLNAKEKYKEALKLNPEYVKTLNNLGVIYAKENRIDEALECWKKALEIDPDYSRAKINLEKIEPFLKK